jgi:hypothetical protein
MAIAIKAIAMSIRRKLVVASFLILVGRTLLSAALEFALVLGRRWRVNYKRYNPSQRRRTSALHTAESPTYDCSLYA